MKLFKTLLILTIVFTNQSYAITMNDFVYRDGLLFKKFTDTPYSGKVEGAEQGYIDSGIRNGEWKFYYANGQIASKGRFQKGLKVGVWEEFDIFGNLQSKGSYSNSLKDGSWAIYSNGEIIESHIYKMGRNLTLIKAEENAKKELEIKLKREEELKTLKSAHINKIASKIADNWVYQGAKNDWGCDVYILRQ